MGDSIDGEQPALAVVVMSFHNERTILAALDSLARQDVPIEVVVSHSDGGPTERLVRTRHPDVRLETSARRRFPGATRNAGVAATRAPYVAFLAADCLALPGWARGRVERHRAGAAGVSSALIPSGTEAACLAANLLQHSNRLPGYAPPPALRFGVSYARAALERHGPFPDGPGFPEDLAVNQRLLAAGEEIAWGPEILTAHAYPRSLRAMLADQHRRGRVHGALHASLGWRMALAARAPLEAATGLRRAATGDPPVPGRTLARTVPALTLATLASAAGRLRGGGDVDDAARAFVAARRRTRLREGRR